MLILMIVMTPFTLIGLFGVAFLINEEYDSYKYRNRKHEEQKPYDSNSDVVKKFQLLAGITPSSPLRDRYNKIRYNL